MERAELLKSKQYWLTKIQVDLFSEVDNYISVVKKINRTEFGKELGVSKGYVSQVLNGDFDHRISKLVDLSLAIGKAPIINFIDIDEIIKTDANSKMGLIDNLKKTTMDYFNIQLISYSFSTGEIKNKLVQAHC